MFLAAAVLLVHVDTWCVRRLSRQRSCLRLEALDLLSLLREFEGLLSGECAGHIPTKERAKC